MTDDGYEISDTMLDVGDGHVLYVYEWGNKDAKTPIIFLHGGPGSQVKDKHKSSFNPKKHRVIFFDQRGSGNSTPFGSLELNTTDNLIEDISKVADKLSADTFILHGSSWGSTLALAYALKYPERVEALVIGGVFTGSKAESDWIDKGKFRTFFPDVWQAYLDRTPVKYRANPSAYHFDKVISGTLEEQKLSGYAYECLESGVIQLDDRFHADNLVDHDPSSIRIEMFYLANGCFMPDRYVLDNATKLTVPVHIVQGRYDMVCPPQTAYELHNKLPNSRLYWTLSGHKQEHEGQNIFMAIFDQLSV